MNKTIGYEKSARFYDMFDTKENIDFFKSYSLQNQEVLDVGAGTGRSPRLRLLAGFIALVGVASIVTRL